MYSNKSDLEKTFINNIMSYKEKSEVFLNSIQSNSCIICFNSISDEEMCVTNCEHKYCFDCLKEWFNRGNISCPFCRQDIEHFFKNNEKNNIVKVTIKEPINNIVNLSVNTPNTGNINENRVSIENGKLVYLKLFTILNITYLLYLQYKNYNLYNSYLLLYNNCTY